MSISVLFEDAWFQAVDKPPGLLTVPAPGKPRCLTEILNRQARREGAAYRLYPCHRLDRETSGVILYAKSRAAQEAMKECFQARRVEKTYLAFVQGRLRKEAGVIEHRLEGAPALTRYRVLQRGKNFSVLEVCPETGRTNQIRIHMRYLGHPVVGESVFAFRKDFALRAKRLCLHARSLRFPHPFTGKTVFLESPLPEDMARFLAAQGLAGCL